MIWYFVAAVLGCGCLVVFLICALRGNFFFLLSLAVRDLVARRDKGVLTPGPAPKMRRKRASA